MPARPGTVARPGTPAGDRAGTDPGSALRVSAGLALVVGLGLGLVGCSGGAPFAVSTSAPTTSAPTTTAATTGPAATPDPTLQPTGDARANLAFFNFVAAGVAEANPEAGGRDFIDALVAGGFDKGDMEVTFDQTNAGLAADSIQFAVRFAGECLIGQNGPAAGGYHGAVMPILGSGTCLVGATRQIDW